MSVQTAGERTPGELSPVPKLASDARRNGFALAIAAAATVVAITAYTLVFRESFSIDTVILTSFVFWTFYSLVYLVVTFLTFNPATAPQLTQWLAATATPRAAARAIDDLSGSGPSASVQWSVLAIIAVGLVAAFPSLLDSPLANALSFAVVASSWLVTVASYAVHYARVDTAVASLEFPGKKSGRVFMDYVYLAAQVSTTFGTSDVNIITTKARRVVTGHTLIAFAYNTFIIALLISIFFLTD